MTQQGTTAVPCCVCDEHFRARRSRIDEGRKLYCSEDCQAKETAANKIYEERPCEHCGETMVLTHTEDVEDRRFCGWECYNLHRPTDPEVLERMARMRNAQLQQTKPTRCEEILYRLMDQAIPGQWEPQLRLFHWTVDAAVPEQQLVVQADGDYWHGLTAAKSGQTPSPSVALTIKKDRAQDKYLTTAGWRVLRLWESELKQDPDWCLRRIKAALQD
ncbi:endonuclease domain-containing protein [Streptomyces sp. NBC_01023]|uniref:endonuclease domain-containing protein n=1 Tax=Streptomyces sp. NBC_01023 TaxID=2903724 RepID=UPI0038642F0C|nr:endonuclease domain-containing protein [Streptomyces sp. NBC_01023]